MIDFSVVRQANPPLPCFGTLERALRFLHAHVQAANAAVYP